MAQASSRVNLASPRETRGGIFPPHIDVGGMQVAIPRRQDRGSGARVRVEARPSEGVGQESLARAPLHLGVLQHRPKRRRVRGGGAV